MEKANLSSREEKEEIIKNLLNKKFPESVSFIIPQETDNLSLLLTLGQELQDNIEELSGNKEKPNILLRYILNNFIVRFSIKGKRSEQITEVIKSIVQEEEKKSHDILKNLKFT